MEPLFLSAVLLLLSLFVSLLLHASHEKQSRNLPPGRMGWPFIGETLQFLSLGRKGFPEKFIEERRKKYCSDIFRTSLLAEKTAVVCGPSANKFVFSNENKLVRVWWPRSVEKVFPTSLQTSTNEESMKMRHLISGFLKPEALAKYIGFTDLVARKHFETYWDFNQQVAAFPLSKRYTFAVACRLVLSIEDPKHIAKFEEPFHVLLLGMLSLPINFPGTPYDQAIKAAKMIRKELVDIIRERKKDLSCRENIVDEVASSSLLLKQDILSHMLTTPDKNGQFMNEMDNADMIIGLLLGGHHTSAAAITFTLNYLVELPEIYEKVLKEQTGIAAGKKHGELLNWEDLQKMKYSYNVVCEVMRLAPPLQGSFREALTDFTFSGFFVPKGWKLYWSTNSTHKDPKYFPEPEKFDPSRFEGNGPAPYTYVPFGGGPRMCPGKEYSRIVVLVFIYNVIRRFRWEKVLPNEKMIVDPLPKPAEGLPIRIHPH